MGPTWVLLAPDGPPVDPMNYAIWVTMFDKRVHVAHEEIYRLPVQYSYQEIIKNVGVYVIFFRTTQHIKVYAFWCDSICFLSPLLTRLSESLAGRTMGFFRA